MAAKSISTSSATRAVLFCPPNFNIKRCRLLTKHSIDISEGGSCVIYWMSRDQRVLDNHALNYALGIANDKRVPLRVVFNLVPKFLQATLRQYGFMIKGLKEVETICRAKEIPFNLLMGNNPNLLNLFHKNILMYSLSLFSLQEILSAIFHNLHKITMHAQSLQTLARCVSGSDGRLKLQRRWMKWGCQALGHARRKFLYSKLMRTM